jgi:hypothetical protein
MTTLPAIGYPSHGASTCSGQTSWSLELDLATCVSAWPSMSNCKIHDKSKK